MFHSIKLLILCILTINVSCHLCVKFPCKALFPFNQALRKIMQSKIQPINVKIFDHAYIK